MGLRGIFYRLILHMDGWVAIEKGVRLRFADYIRLGDGTVGLTGSNSSKFKELVDIAICIPTNKTSHIQEVHLSIGHILCAIVEQDMSGI